MAVAPHIKTKPNVDVIAYTELNAGSKAAEASTGAGCARTISGLCCESSYIIASAIAVFIARAADDIPYKKTVKLPLLLFLLNQRKK